MTREEEIEIVKEMIKDYELSRWFGWIPFIGWNIKVSLRTDVGFCYYLFRNKGFSYCDIPESIVNAYIKLHGRPLPSHYWFKCGEIKPRLAILKEALKILEDQ